MQDSPKILDDKKYALYGKRSENTKGAPKMQFQVYRGNPSISVFTNDENDTEKKPIRVGMDASIWSNLISGLMHVTESEPNTHLQMLNYTGPVAKKFIDSTTQVGRDKEGVVYIAIRKEGRPVKKFPLLPGLYSDVADAEGNPLEEGKKSVLFARGFVKQLNDMMCHYMRETYETPQQQPQGGGGNRGGGYGGGGNQGGGSGAPSGGSTDFDDDLPM